MTQYQFSLNIDDLKEAVMNSDMETVIKASVVMVLNEVMEKEREEHLQAGRYERSETRQDYRNGYYERELLLSIGTVTLRVPRTRNGEFSPSVFERYARCDQAFVLAMLEMVVNGVSTRKVTKVVEQLCGKGVSKSFVSSLTAKLDPVVNHWADRPLNTHYYRYLMVDAMYLKAREHNRVVSKAAYIAVGIREDATREILGLQVSHRESHTAWKEFLQSLKRRGLQSPQLVISDAHEGLKKAIQEEFIGTCWQRCLVHFKRNILHEVARKYRPELSMAVQRIFAVVSPEEARHLKGEFVAQYEGDKHFEKAVATLEEGFEDAIQYLNEPVARHTYIRSTNSLERLNQEVRRREQVIRIFPNTQSAFRLIGAVLMDYAEKFGKRHLWPLKEKKD